MVLFGSIQQLILCERENTRMVVFLTDKGRVHPKKKKSIRNFHEFDVIYMKRASLNSFRAPSSEPTQQEISQSYLNKFNNVTRLVEGVYVNRNE